MMSSGIKPGPQTSATIAKLFGVTSKRVQQLVADGVIQTMETPKGRRYDLIPTIQQYIKYLSDKANGREKKEMDSNLESQKLEAEARLKQAKAEVAELELDELRAIMHRAEDVEAIMTDHVLMLRSMLMALPGKLAVDLANIDNASEAAERIRKDVYDILNQLADYQYDEEKFKKRVRERNGWEERNDESEDETTY